MDKECFQLFTDYVRYRAEVWDCNDKCEFELTCGTNAWLGETILNGVKHSITNFSKGIFLECYNSVLAEIRISTGQLWERFAEITIGSEIFFLRKSYPASGLKLLSSHSIPVLILESKWYEDKQRNFLMRLFTRKPYYLITVADTYLDRLQLLQLLAICSYCILVFKAIDFNEYSGNY